VNLPQFDRETLSKLSPRDLKVLIWRQKWLQTARPKQLPPDITDHGNGIDPDWQEWWILSGRGFGKLVDVETPVPTPVGWRKLKDLRVGDEVFDEAGAPCRILKTFDDTPKVAYRLTFSDGTFIDCCDEHQWVTWTHRDRKEYLRNGPKTDFPENWPAYRQWQPRNGTTVGPEIRTTQDIVDTLRQDTARRDLNHCIPLTGALRYPEKALPLEPWVFGYWLGNGALAGGQIACHPDDVDEVERRFGALGFAATRARNGRDFYAKGFATHMRSVGLLGDKRVPDDYMQASIEQRRGLLAGLLDSDGHCHAKTGHVEFCSTTRALADAVLELARSLGEKPTLSEGRATQNGEDHGAKYRVTWRPNANPFSLPRKAAAWRPPASQALRNRHRMIVAAERIDPVPMRCLTVDGPNSMFLVGEGMIPTHNTLTGANWLGYEALMDQDPRNNYSFVIAPTLNDVRYTCFEGSTGLLSILPPEVIADYNKTNLIITLDNGGIIRGFSAEEPERLRGPQAARVWGDEGAAWTADQGTWDMMMFGLRLGNKPRIVMTTTPKPKAFIRDHIDAKPHRHITTGSSYENRENLASTFFEQLQTYEGTQLGRQEIEGEVIDAEEGGIIQRGWIKLWPHDKPLPAFEMIIMSLDTAFTEKTLDKKNLKADPTACGVWGVFWHEEGGRSQTNIMLLDAWEDHLSLPELRKKVKRESQIAYGDDTNRPAIKPLIGPPRMANAGRKPDVILIEDKGSGISLRQELAADGIDTYPYNPGREDKLTRLHLVSDVFAQGKVWFPASEKPTAKRAVKTWADPVLVQLCSYRGPNSIKHDDHLDQTTQAIRLAKNKGWLQATRSAVDTRGREPEYEGRSAHRPRRKQNPYDV
jgi:hypothetical protein